MTVEQTEQIDFATLDHRSGELWLTVSDHLPWDVDEGAHLTLLQNKLNAYPRFIESGELLSKIPEAKGRRIVIDLTGRFPLSEPAEEFFRKAQLAIENAGFGLQFRLLRPN
jgi:Family of unknown function (DUF6572)